MTLLLLGLAPAFAALRCLEARATGYPAFARLGATAGALAMAASLWWLPATIWRYDRGSLLLLAPALAAFALLGAVLFVSIGWLRRRTGLPFPLLAAMTWTSAEWLLAEAFAFPWFTLGIAIAGVTPLAQVADLVGAHGLSALLVAGCAALAEAWVLRADRRAALGRLLAVCLGLLGTGLYGDWRLATLTTRPVARAALIHPDVGVHDKWDPRFADQQLDHLVAASQRTAAARPELIVWPEVAVPGVLQDHRRWDNAIATLSAGTGSSVLVGALDRGTDSPRAGNAAFFYQADGGRAWPTYRKRSLVPFVEHAAGVEPGRAAPLFPAGSGRFGVLICYESAFSDLARDYRRRGADFLVNMTNDAWFVGTGGPSQGLAHLRLRAIENRMGIVRVANGGPSGFIDAAGRLSLADSGVALTAPGTTVMTRAGDWVCSVALACTATLFGVCLLFTTHDARRTVVMAPPAPAPRAPGCWRFAPGC